MVKEKKVIITRKKTTKKQGKSKAKVKKPEKAPIPEFLSPDHLRQVEVLGAEVENVKLKMHVREQAVANLRLRMTILKHELELALKFVNDTDKEYNNKKKVRTQLINDFKNLYKIKDESFAYDPDNGRIVRDS